MVKFSRHKLSNGLIVLIIPDDSTPFVTVNVTYNVGARDENPERTGFAHLFEHLMFSGSQHAPKFDTPLEQAGASNNAFTSNDLTNYYDIIPRENLDIALWLESDRMAFLNVNARNLEIQRKVVIEEFKERYLNQPYGSAWHHLRALAYKKHPYQWPTIGKNIEQIATASLEDVQTFYKKFYQPNNAIITLAGNVTDDDVPLVEKYFKDLESGDKYERNLPQEPEQKTARRLEVIEQVPIDALYIAFHMPGKNNEGYYECDLISDLLSNGESSRLYLNLVKQKELFSDLSAFILGSFDPGLLVITGKPQDGVSSETAEQAIWDQLEALIQDPPSQDELQKVKNKVEANLTYQLIEPMNQALNLAFFELIGGAELLNEEAERYQKVTLDSLQHWSKKILKKENSNTLWIKSKA